MDLINLASLALAGIVGIGAGIYLVKAPPRSRSRKRR